MNFIASCITNVAIYQPTVRSNYYIFYALTSCYIKYILNQTSQIATLRKPDKQITIF